MTTRLIDVEIVGTELRSIGRITGTPDPGTDGGGKAGQVADADGAVTEAD